MSLATHLALAPAEPAAPAEGLDFARVYEQHVRFVCRTLRRLGVPHEDCDDALQDVFERYPEHERGRYVACGGGPAIAVMKAARALGASEGRVLKYGHSGEVSGDNDGVVGYLAAAFGSFTDAH